MTEPASRGLGWPGRGMRHFLPSGDAHLHDVGGDEIGDRRASAEGLVRLTPEAVAALRSDPRNDAAAMARAAGLLASKRVAELIPTHHQALLSGSRVDVQVVDAGVEIIATVHAQQSEGVETEALAAVTIAGLTVLDLLRPLDPRAELDAVRVVASSHGGHDEWRAPESRAEASSPGADMFDESDWLGS